jgi:hypothetical protein
VKKTFTRALIANAVLQFVVTRQRAGHAIEEGAAEALWVRYPFVVVLNALVWTIMLSMLGRVGSLLRHVVR